MQIARRLFRVIPVLMMITIAVMPVVAQDGGDDFVTGEAIVSSIEIVFGDGEETPVVSVTARGDLPDSCTRLQDVSQETNRDENIITMTLTTVRPADAVCAQSLEPFEVSFGVDLTDLPAGTYTVVVNGVEASFRLTSEMVRSAIDLQGPALCPDPEPGLSTYVNGYDGVCFLFPDGYEVTTPEPGLTVVTAPEDITHDVRPTLTIRVADVEGETAQDVVDGIAAESGLELVSSEVTAQTRPMIIVENIPGDVVTRQAFTVRFSVLYHVTVQPTDPAVAGSDVAENLWSIVMDSLRFVEVDRNIADVPVVDGLFSLLVMDDLELTIVVPGGWSLGEADGVYGLVPPESYGLEAGAFVVTFYVIPGMPMDTMNNFGMGLRDYYEAQGESDFQLAEILIGFRNAVLVVGLEQSCLTAVVPTNAGAVSINALDAACNADGILEDTTILTILNSVRVITPES